MYRPGVPSDTVAAARAFAKKLSDPAWRTAFVAKLPADGKLVIHHTSGQYAGQFEAHVVFDVPGSNGKTLHYDEDGAQFSIPEDSGGAL